jgi:hypothetical protein
MAIVSLMGPDEELNEIGESIVAAMGGEARTAEWFVQLSAAPGQIGTFGLTERLLPHLDELAHHAPGRRERRRAAKFSQLLGAIQLAGRSRANRGPLRRDRMSAAGI